MTQRELDIIRRAMVMTPPDDEAMIKMARAVARGEQVHPAMFYSYFLPKIPRTRPKSLQAWVGMARAGKSDPREYLHYLYCDGNRLCATNGHVLNCAIVPGLLDQPGFYNPSLERVPMQSDVKYPNIDRVIPDDTYSITYWLDDLNVFVFDTTSSVEHCYVIGEGYFNRTVLAPALLDRQTFTVLNSGQAWDRPIKIEGPYPDSFSIVMPMRRPDKRR